MPSDLSGLVRLGKEHIEQASRVLSRAFLNDPELVGYIADPVKRQEVLRLTFRIDLHHAIKHGEVYTVSPAIEGVAIWFPPTAPEMNKWNFWLHGGLGLLFQGSWGFLNKMDKDEHFADRLRWRLAPFAYWYLSGLGVAPEFQGKGYASRLLRPMLARLDAQKLPAYLETSTPEYVPLYQHFGFKVLEEVVLPGSGTKMWAMLRKND